MKPKTKAAAFAAVLFLCFTLAAVFLPASVFAAQGAAVTVSTAEGAAGETVVVTVSIKGVGSLTGVEGISGGQFELIYDPALVSVVTVKKGSLLDNEVVFLPNQNFAGNSIKVAWALSSGVIEGDGDLCNITFTLKKAGAVSPVLKDLVLYDQDVRPLVMGTETVGGTTDGNTIVLHPPGAEPETGMAGPGSEQTDPADTEPGDDGNVTPGEETDDPLSGETGSPPDEADQGNPNSRYLPLLILGAVLVAVAVAFLFFRRSRSGKSA